MYYVAKKFQKFGYMVACTLFFSWHVSLLLSSFYQNDKKSFVTKLSFRWGKFSHLKIYHHAKTAQFCSCAVTLHLQCCLLPYYFECAFAVAFVCSIIKDSWLQIKIPYDLFYFKPTAAFTLYGLPNTAPTAMETFPKRIIDEES